MNRKKPKSHFEIIKSAQMKNLNDMTRSITKKWNDEVNSNNFKEEFPSLVKNNIKPRQCHYKIIEGLPFNEEDKRNHLEKVKREIIEEWDADNLANWNEENMIK